MRITYQGNYTVNDSVVAVANVPHGLIVGRVDVAEPDRLEGRLNFRQVIAYPADRVYNVQATVMLIRSSAGLQGPLVGECLGAGR